MEKMRAPREVPEIVSVRELMVILHIGRNSAYALLKSGEIASLRVGKKYIIPLASVSEYLDRAGL